jgi:hypothetical protein
MPTFVTFFDGFATKNNGDMRLFWWFCFEEGDGNNVIAFLYGDGNRQFCFLFFWSLWFSSLELTMNNEMMVSFYVDGCNG